MTTIPKTPAQSLMLPFLSRSKSKRWVAENQAKPTLRTMKYNKHIKNRSIKNIQVHFMILKKRKAEREAQIISLGWGLGGLAVLNMNLDWGRMGQRRGLSSKNLKKPKPIASAQ